MNSRIISATAAIAVAMSSLAAGAQDRMSKPMEMGKEKSYTGCVETGAAAGTFALAHATSEMAMGKDAMKKDTMGKDAMKKDAMGKDAMKNDAMHKGGMDMATLSISSESTDLSKHIGHKVTITGTEDNAHAFTVTSLKMVAATCGK